MHHYQSPWQNDKISNFLKVVMLSLISKCPMLRERAISGVCVLYIHVQLQCNFERHSEVHVCSHIGKDQCSNFVVRRGVSSSETLGSH